MSARPDVMTAHLISVRPKSLIGRGLSTVHGVVFALFCFPAPQAQNKSAPHPLQHLLDMGDRGFRLDAVAEIEDQPPLGVIRQHVIDGAVERRAGSIDHRSNSRGGSTPAQVSKICTASAPALSWPSRY